MVRTGPGFRSVEEFFGGFFLGHYAESLLDDVLGLRAAAEGTDNLIPHILDCVRKLTTEGEIVEELKQVFGQYREPAI